MKKSRKLFGSQTFQLAPGLTKQEAYKAASKKARRDFRGCKYDRKTGLVVLT